MEGVLVVMVEKVQPAMVEVDQVDLHLLQVEELKLLPEQQIL